MAQLPFVLRDPTGRIVKGVAVAENGKLHLQFLGYGTNVADPGRGWPVVVEVKDGKLQLSVADDINQDVPQVVPMEGAKERRRSIPRGEALNSPYMRV